MSRFFVLFMLFGMLLSPAAAIETVEDKTVFVPDVGHQVFRAQVIDFVKGFASQHFSDVPFEELDQLEKQWNNSYQLTHWNIEVTAYYQGQLAGQGEATGKDLTSTLKQATNLAMQATDKTAASTLEDYRFKVNFDYHPAKSYTLIDYQDHGLELLGNRVAVRQLDVEALKKQIKDSQAYLLRHMHPDYAGFFKFYDADKDTSQTLLRTTYTATALYTLIKLYQYQKDLALESYFKDIASFLLDRQLKTGPNAGGFEYGFNPETQESTCRIVVGTTSKTVFTLLLMHELYPDEKQYLDAARAAGDWLLSTIKEDGHVTPIAKCNGEESESEDKHSFLYTGQVLSALSRLYAQTEDERYLDGARKIAGLFLTDVATQGPLVADDYRPPNSISSSWVMMSLLDLAKVDPAPAYLTTINQIADMLLSRQIDNPDDAFNHGRYLDAMTTSGNGWINEVMGELHKFCKAQASDDCQPYRQAMRHTSRWLVQNAYNETNSFNIKNPERALGGFITNFNTRTVRTDAVCHGLNGLVRLLEIEGSNDEILVNLPERPLRELLPLLRAGEYE
ncbi:hypothetical protein [Methylophaga sp. OBS4]|uniref:hypothetical protein n=1 Tax=Methylophaga sp. OBS4 TaxID=2991935 RepID=UPI0022539A4C|nr:hypothetical protein [Methylophaga sp. OBS4]MCX4186315.1 hypothetical protein [Methylophaga sp. OBS4]